MWIDFLCIMQDNEDDWRKEALFSQRVCIDWQLKQAAMPLFCNIPPIYANDMIKAQQVRIVMFFTLVAKVRHLRLRKRWLLPATLTLSVCLNGRSNLNAPTKKFSEGSFSNECETIS
jgi:hypothetical protein